MRTIEKSAKSINLKWSECKKKNYRNNECFSFVSIRRMQITYFLFRAREWFKFNDSSAHWPIYSRYERIINRKCTNFQQNRSKYVFTIHFISCTVFLFSRGFKDLWLEMWKVKIQSISTATLIFKRLFRTQINWYVSVVA